jgi:hypothetical protein
MCIVFDVILLQNNVLGLGWTAATSLALGFWSYLIVICR